LDKDQAEKYTVFCVRKGRFVLHVPVATLLIKKGDSDFGSDFKMIMKCSVSNIIGI